MKAKIIGLFIWSLLTLNISNTAIASEANNELATRIFMPQGTQLQEYGISKTENSVELLTVLKVSGKNMYRYIIVKDGKISVRKARQSEIKSKKALPLRMAVLSNQNGTNAYFYKQVKNNTNIAQANEIAENNWRAIFIDIESQEQLYLWYEPSEFQKTTIELASTAPTPDAEYAEDVRVYPNPVTNAKNAQLSFKLKEAQTLSINLYDITGREVANILTNQFLASGSYNYTIPTEALVDGMYIAYITNDLGESVSKKIVVLN